MWQKQSDVIKVGKTLVSWHFLGFMYRMSPSSQFTNPPRCVIVQKEGSFQTLHFPNFLSKFLNKRLYTRGKDEKPGGRADIRTQKAFRKMLCCWHQGLAWSWSPALCLERAGTQSSLWHCPKSHSILLRWQLSSALSKELRCGLWNLFQQ